MNSSVTCGGSTEGNQKSIIRDLEAMKAKSGLLFMKVRISFIKYYRL